MTNFSAAQVGALPKQQPIPYQEPVLRCYLPAPICDAAVSMLQRRGGYIEERDED